MGFFSKLFEANDSDDETGALRALEEFERLAERDSPVEGMEFMAGLGGRHSKMLGPNGPLHGRFIACLDRLKEKAARVISGQTPLTNAEMEKIQRRIRRGQ